MASVPVGQDPSVSYRVHARTIDHGHAEAVRGSRTVPFDTAWGDEQPDSFGPAELLASALAACLLKGLERSARLMPFAYQSAEVDVVAERQDQPPRFTSFRYELRIATDESERRVQLLHENLRRFGTVFNTLAPTCALEGSIVALTVA